MEIDCSLSTSYDFEEMNALANNVFGMHRTLEEFVQKFSGSPSCDSRAAPAVLGRVKGQLIGMLCVLPQQVLLCGKAVRAVQILDSCVLPQFQRKGVHESLYLWGAPQYAPMNRFVFAFGFPGQIASDTLVKLRPTAVESMHIERITVLQRYRAAGFSSTAARPFDGFAVTADTAVPSDWDDYLVASQARFVNATRRTAAYMKWRYASTADRRFVFLTIRRWAAVVGIAVVRVTPGSSGEAVTAYELIADSASAVTALCDHMKAGSQEVNLWVTSAAPWMQEMRAAGFLPVAGDALDMVAGPLVASNDPRLENVNNGHDWYLTLGDTDL